MTLINENLCKLQWNHRPISSLLPHVSLSSWRRHSTKTDFGLGPSCQLGPVMLVCVLVLCRLMQLLWLSIWCPPKVCGAVLLQMRAVCWCTAYQAGTGRLSSCLSYASPSGRYVPHNSSPFNVLSPVSPLMIPVADMATQQAMYESGLGKARIQSCVLARGRSQYPLWRPFLFLPLLCFPEQEQQCPVALHSTSEIWPEEVELSQPGWRCCTTSARYCILLHCNIRLLS